MITTSHSNDLDDNRRETRRRDQRWALAVLVLVLSFVALLGVAVYDPNDRKFVSWDMLGVMIRPETGFRMGGVAFGMTPSAVGKLHPAHKAGADVQGRTIMSFAHQGADYTVWFLDQKNGQLAYRIRFHRVIEDGDEDQILGLLGEQFGAPITGQCESSLVSGARDCFYGWQIASVDLNALVQAPTPTGPAGTVGLRLTAENVEMAARLEDTKPRI